jgi:hypothetical protein
MDIVIGILAGALIAVLAIWGWRRSAGGPASVEVRSQITQMRSVGELIVFRLITQQIITAEGQASRWLNLFISNRRMALIIEYEVDFKYDLRSAAFRIEPMDDGAYRLVMPPCGYHVHIRDMKIYDEQGSRLLPFLLGDITKAFGPGFSAEDKNRLLEEGRSEANAKAKLQAQQLQSEAQSSARQTLEALARTFGAQRVEIDFTESPLAKQNETTTPATAEHTADVAPG